MCFCDCLDLEIADIDLSIQDYVVIVTILWWRYSSSFFICVLY